MPIISKIFIESISNINNVYAIVGRCSKTAMRFDISWISLYRP